MSSNNIENAPRENREIPSECNIQVACRVRPLNAAEERTGSKFVMKFPTSDSISIAGKVYVYDKVFKPDVCQEAVYNETAKPIVSDVLSGYNGTIFAYGQTSSGKTHTMEGSLWDMDEQGIIPRIVSDIFNHIYQMDENLEFHIKVSYFEIYLDRIRDLLDVTKTNLSVHEDKNRVPFVKGTTERFVSSPDEVMEIIDEGKANRHVAVTNMNEHSSRSHCVFLINVKQENVETQKKLSGKLYLVDLAGSEKVSRTGAEGAMLDEAKNINKSLSALGNVIAALADDNKVHVPYRDSKLTRILQESLGGNARTVMIICTSPASYNESESKSTLLFGQRVKTIKNVVTVNEELTADEWKRRYEKEKARVKSLRDILSKKEWELQRWRLGETVPPDEQEALDTSVINPIGLVTTAPAAPGAEKARWDSERNGLFHQLDEKDDEINQQCHVVETYKAKISELEDLLISIGQEYDQLELDKNKLHAENEAARDEVKEVLQALEELATSYDQKSQEVEIKEQKNETLQEELTNKEAAAYQLEGEFSRARENMAIQKRRIGDSVASLRQDLIEVGSLMGGNTGEIKPLFKPNDKIEDDINVTRLFVHKMKSEAQTLVARCGTLETTNGEAQRIIAEYEKQIAQLRLLLQQHETRLKTNAESIRDKAAQNEMLEQQIDKLSMELAKLRAEEKLYLSELSQHQEEKLSTLAAAEEMRKTMEEQMEARRELQISEHRKLIAEKQNCIDQLNSDIERLTVQNDVIRKDCAKVKAEEENAMMKLEEVEKREQARSEMKALTETALEELQRLHELRKMFVSNMQAKIKKADKTSTSDLQSSSDNNLPIDDDDEEYDSGIQKEKVEFLENNLEQLTKVHKQLVRDNADLRIEVPKLEKRLRTTLDRVKYLETALTESKEVAQRERQRYQRELDKIKDAVRCRGYPPRRIGNSPQIAKPIRAGKASSGKISANSSHVIKADETTHM